jgi:hypothetical protein
MPKYFGHGKKRGPLKRKYASIKCRDSIIKKAYLECGKAIDHYLIDIIHPRDEVIKR